MARRISAPMGSQGIALGGYVDSLLAEGQLDSTGTFAIDAMRADLLSGSSLYARSGAFILKLIQAAVATRPRKVEILTSRDAIEVHYTPTRDRPSLDELERAISAPFAAHGSAHLKNLSLGLHVAAAQCRGWVLWGYRDSNQGWGTLLQGPGAARRVEIPRSQEPGCLFQLKYQSTFWKRVLRASSLAADVTQLVAERCRFCHCPIYLDHRLMNAPSIPRLTAGRRVNLLKNQIYYEHLVERAILSKQCPQELLVIPCPRTRPARHYDLGSQPRKVVQGCGMSAFLYQWRSFRGPADLFPFENSPPPTSSERVLEKAAPNSVYLSRHPTYETMEIGVEDFQDWTRPAFQVSGTRQDQPLAGHAYLVGPGLVKVLDSQVQVVQYGVTLEPHPVQLAMPGMWAWLADDRLETDLSGLKVLENQRFKDLVAWLCRESHEMQEDLEKLETPYEVGHGPLQVF